MTCPVGYCTGRMLRGSLCSHLSMRGVAFAGSPIPLVLRRERSEPRRAGRITSVSAG
jgi:hypothetical protein